MAEVVKVEKHPKADKLLVLQLKLENTQRQVVSGISEYFDLDELLGRKVVLVANLKPVILRGIESQGMILAATDNKELKLLTANINPGAIIS